MKQEINTEAAETVQTKEIPAVAPVATCSSCLFWLRASAGTNSGDCRRRCPQVVAYTESETSGEQGEYREKVDTYTRTEFPSTLATDWCGEYQTNITLADENEK